MNFDVNAALESIASPPILFFFLGVLAVAVKSDLDIPKPLPKFFSIYLLTVIGFKGGVELYKGGLHSEVILTLSACILMSIAVPLYTFFILRRKMDDDQAAAICATYGSISAVTFVTAVAFLDFIKVKSGGHMVAAMALMESPALIVGVILNKKFNKQEAGGNRGIGHILHESMTNGSVFLIMGALVVGLITNERGWAGVKAFDAIFKGMLMLYLLDMGIQAAKEIKKIREAGVFILIFAILVPLFNAAVGILLAKIIGATQGDALLLTVLCASASYIAIPAAIPNAIPRASAGLCTSMSLGITFPFNVLIGIPIYYAIISELIPA